VNAQMRELGELSEKLIAKPWWTKAPEVHTRYHDEQHDCFSFTDASAEGWGAISRWKNGEGFKYQQR
jgi:hypothetical protein